jgi:hypothetical protein
VTALAACPGCGGTPLHKWGIRTVSDPGITDGELRFSPTTIQRRRCAVCRSTYDDPDPERARKVGEALRFMVACLATDGPEAAADRCGLDARTLISHVEAEVRRSLSDPIPDTVFLGAVPNADGAVVLGEAAGIVLDAAEGGASSLGDILDRRGGEVGFAWVPFAASVRDAARDTMPDAILALCSAETVLLLDRVLDALDRAGVADAALLRHATGSGWAPKTYDGLRALASRARFASACVALDLFDDEIRNALAAAGASPGVRVPEQLHGLPPLRLRGLAVVTDEPTLATMSRSLVLSRQMRRPK